MTLDEIIDDFFFFRLTNAERGIYRKRLTDEEVLATNIVSPPSFLIDIQHMWNTALANMERGVHDYAWEGPIHFFYVDSDIPNAIAFRHRGYGFIGATLPMIVDFWHVAVALGSSANADLRAALDLKETPEDGLRAVLFRLQMGIVITHEFTHLVHGHVADSWTDSAFVNEILTDLEVGNFEQQVREADADAYALHLVLWHSLDSYERGHDVALLGIDSQPIERQDDILLWCVVAALTGFLFAQTPQHLNDRTAYSYKHPLQAARLHLALHSFLTWWSRHRPKVGCPVTPTKFGVVFRSAATAVHRLNGGKGWEQQRAFLSSADGKRYLDSLFANLNALMKGSNQSGDQIA